MNWPAYLTMVAIWWLAINALFIAWIARPFIARHLRQSICPSHYWAAGRLVKFDDEGRIQPIDFCPRCGKRERAN